MSRIVDTIRSGARARPSEAATMRRDARQDQGDAVLGAVAYFHMGDRDSVERVVDGLTRLGIRHLRTAVSWADWERDGGPQWFGWVIPRLLEQFDVLPCVLYTPPEKGLMPKTSSPPKDPEDYGRFVDLLLTEYPGAFSHVELWNEPNNYIEWDWTVDPEWNIFARMIASASERAHSHGVKTVLGGMSPFDPNWLNLMYQRGAMHHMDVIGVHGFPGTWEAVWEGWSSHIARVREVADANGHSPELWITECGFSTWNHDEYRMLLELVDAAAAPADRVYWYSAEDLNPVYETLDGFHADERAYHFGLFRIDGSPKLPARVWAEGGFDDVRAFAHIAGSDRPDGPATLVTGGAGFVGTNLIDRLCSEGTPVVVLDNLSRPGVERNLRWLKEKHGDLVFAEIGDIRDRFAIRRALSSCDRVFHLAAQVAVTTSLLDPQTDLGVNLQGTVNLLEEMRRLPSPPPLLFTSTNKVYGALEDLALTERHLRYEPVDPDIASRGISESRPLAFASPYGCSKGAADQYVLDYGHSFGLETIVFRMSCVYGPHQFGTEDQGWVAHFMIQALDDSVITIYGNGKQVRDVLHVDDLVDAMTVAIADPAAYGKAFNIGGGPENAVSLLEVLDAIEEVDGRRPEVSFSDWRRADQPYYVSDTSAFGDAFGWKPRVGVEEGLASLYRWLRENAAASLPQR
ncbi:MAG TPA: NAD-dependent epimerase/dehydratase family protein [Actinomycetota bacterium]|nr:NAD-dependent epimerase/dehydratase family protein [Actinomycetota bacterium]